MADGSVQSYQLVIISNHPELSFIHHNAYFWICLGYFVGMLQGKVMRFGSGVWVLFNMVSSVCLRFRHVKIQLCQPMVWHWKNFRKVDGNFQLLMPHSSGSVAMKTL